MVEGEKKSPRKLLNGFNKTGFQFTPVGLRDIWIFSFPTKTIAISSSSILTQRSSKEVDPLYSFGVACVVLYAKQWA